MKATVQSDNEITNPAPETNDRRRFLKLSAAAVAAPLLLRSQTSTASEPAPLVLPPSPPTTPWKDELPLAVTPQTPLAALNPMPTVTANTESGECGRAEHQRYDELCEDKYVQFYQLHAKVNPEWVFHKDYPKQTIWGFALPGSNEKASIPGPLFAARYGQPIVARFYNDLPPMPYSSGGSQAELLRSFGSPEISVHLHNLHAPSESDGFPGDYFSATKSGPTLPKPATPGQYKDHFYPNIYAGFDALNDGIGDPKEALGTLWYHDHTLDFTASNLYRGLFGFYFIYDQLDTGSETTGLRLPSGAYDYPLSFGDRRFDSSGVLVYDQFNPEGTLGDKVIVNGKIEPVLKVAARRYRFRMLNAGPSRFYALYLVDANNNVKPVTYLANDGNLLPNSLINFNFVELGVAERADIVVDFSKFAKGTELYLVNRMIQDETRRPKEIKGPGVRVMKFVVDRMPSSPDRSNPNLMKTSIPLRPLPTLPSVAELAALPVRSWAFARSGGLWTINEKLVDVNVPRAEIPLGSAEIWELTNTEDGWDHPIHIHFEEGRILSKLINGVAVAVPVHERGRKDVFVLHPFERLRVLMHFRDFKGKYVMHCHNLVHEDHAMMLRFDIVDPPA
ncbi:multicopper oxidase domain-containing protein [Pseudomonas sp. LS44]|uniref:multicopper oxidase family protein n=1 Tax=Pseudomonas sp. LS44 TaxID=1357074 RepID=UPI00215ADEE1|nr:multicopper oxidase domain-containing protein [Pseudomonas sp. LS44]UVE18172.1 multicopper oxidase domain-containing protein [Pseudomonas sp. LS44]